MAGFFGGIGRFFGVVLILLGIAVFVIRLQHGGPYAYPEGGNLLGAVLAFVIGLWFLRPIFRTGKISHLIGWPAVLATPLVMFFTLYSTLAELEEVISLQVTAPSGAPVALRLWVVDRDGSAWTTMSDDKAVENGLDRAQGQMLRGGKQACVDIVRHNEPETVQAILDMKLDKYAVARLAASIGVYPETAGDGMTSIEMTPCAQN